MTALAPDGTKVGLTISSFNSASLAPPLVLWSLMKNATSMPVFESISHYAVNVLGAPQKAMAMQFSRKEVDRWEGVDYQLGATGVPLLTGACSRIPSLGELGFTGSSTLDPAMLGQALARWPSHSLVLVPELLRLLLALCANTPALGARQAKRGRRGPGRGLKRPLYLIHRTKSCKRHAD